MQFFTVMLFVFFGLGLTQDHSTITTGSDKVALEFPLKINEARIQIQVSDLSDFGIINLTEITGTYNPAKPKCNFLFNLTSTGNSSYGTGSYSIAITTFKPNFSNVTAAPSVIRPLRTLSP